MHVIRCRSMVVGILLIAAAPVAAADTPPPPRPIAPEDTLAAMLSAAYRSGDDATIKAVLGVAKATFPDDVAEIDRLAAGDAAVLARTRKEAQEKEQARIAAATFFEIWKGELELGASRSTGSTQVVGLYASAKLTRDGLKWRQQVTGRIDFQQTDHVTTTQRIIAAWQPQYKWSDRTYSYGLLQYESDRSLGYSNRETVGAGFGYTAYKGPKGTLNLEGGPAMRETDFLEQPNRTTLAGRASLTGHFSLTPTLQLSQDASVFVEQRDTTASATSSVDTKLIGNLKARLSYNIQYEQDAPTGRNELDTISRATLVYAF
jgi:putative salt-induced outer membrane protein